MSHRYSRNRTLNLEGYHQSKQMMRWASQRRTMRRITVTVETVAFLLALSLLILMVISLPRW